MDQFDPDKLERLAALLDGFDDEAAAQARQTAHDIRAGLLTPATLGEEKPVND